MIFAYILAVLWTGGCTIGYGAALKSLWEDGDTMLLTLLVCLGLPIFLLTAVLPWAFIESEASPNLVTLKKGAWACSAAHQEHGMVMAGKVMVPTTTTVCDAYARQ